MIWLGSPPKYSTYLLTQRNASIWSNIPALPGTSSVSNERKPFERSKQGKCRKQILVQINLVLTKWAETVLDRNENDVVLHVSIRQIFKGLPKWKCSSVDPNHNRKGCSRLWRQLYIEIKPGLKIKNKKLILMGLIFTCGEKTFRERQSSLAIPAWGHPALLLVVSWTSSIGYGAFGMGG